MNLYYLFDNFISVSSKSLRISFISRIRAWNDLLTGSMWKWKLKYFLNKSTTVVFNRDQLQSKDYGCPPDADIYHNWTCKIHFYRKFNISFISKEKCYRYYRQQYYRWQHINSPFDKDSKQQGNQWIFGSLWFFTIWMSLRQDYKPIKSNYSASFFDSEKSIYYSLFTRKW